MDELLHALRRFPKRSTRTDEDRDRLWRKLVLGLAAATTAFAVVVLWTVWAKADEPVAFVPTEQTITEAIRDVGELTGWRTNGIALPTVLMVPELAASVPRQIRFGEYDKVSNTIRISRACEAYTIQHTCRAILIHELIHWVQRASVRWPGTFLEWELEAQMYEARWLAREQARGLPPQPIVPGTGHVTWTPAGKKPSPEFLRTKLSALLPAEARAVWTDQAVAFLMSASNEERDLLLNDGCFLDTKGMRVCVWVLRMLTRVGMTMYGTVVTLRNEQPLSVDLRRFNDDTSTPEVLGWWWDRGWTPTQAGQLPADAVWTGVWVRTRGSDDVRGAGRATREGE